MLGLSKYDTICHNSIDVLVRDTLYKFVNVLLQPAKFKSVIPLNQNIIINIICIIPLSFGIYFISYELLIKINYTITYLHRKCK